MTTDPTGDRQRAGGGMWLNGAPIDSATGARTMSPQARGLKLIGSTLMVVPVILAVVVVVLGGLHSASLSWIPVVAALVSAVLVTTGITVIGFRAEPLDRAAVGHQAERVALQRFSTGFFLRLALSEVPALVALALTFAFPPISLFSYLPGGVLSLVLMVAYVRPSRSTVARVESALDAGGARSNLSAQFGY